MRSWSLLKEPPQRIGERRLAVERENFPLEAMAAGSIEEQAFGVGRVFYWDAGTVALQVISPVHMLLTFEGNRISGNYQFRRMRWYPGNRWMLTKVQPPRVRPPAISP